MQGKKNTYGQGRVNFLAARDEVEKMINAGHMLRDIYDEKSAGLGISYTQFTRYVGKYITQKEHQKGEGVAKQSTVSNSTSATKATEQQARPDPKKGFSHDPNSGNARDDLI